MRYSHVPRSAFAWTTGIVATVGFTLVGLLVTPFQRGRLLQHRLAGSWGRVCIRGSGCPVRVEGLERIDPDNRFVVMVNHQSALDIPKL